MKMLLGAACVAIIASAGYYLTGEYAAHAAHYEQQKSAIAAASFNDCKSAVFDASMQKGYQGADIRKATPATLRGDRCIIAYPQLADYASGSALDMVQRRERIKQLTAAN